MKDANNKILAGDEEKVNQWEYVEVVFSDAQPDQPQRPPGNDFKGYVSYTPSFLISALNPRGGR